MHATLSAVMAALVLACAPRQEPEPGVDPRKAEVALEVESHNWSDVVIYLVRGQANQRVGTVGALGTATFVLSYNRVGSGGDIRLRADPIGGPRAFTSEELRVQPGQWIKWTLENDLNRSFLAVYD